MGGSVKAVVRAPQRRQTPGGKEQEKDFYAQGVSITH
jgi:hypothetical protein